MAVEINKFKPYYKLKYLIGTFLIDIVVREKISHEFGLKRSSSKNTLPVVCCLMRNGAYWLPNFLDHYRELGVKEFYFLDNGSTDDTLQILKKEKDVGVYTSSLPFKRMHKNLRRALIEITRPKGWVIGVDIDELFDYPYSDQVSLTRLCEYMEHSHFNAMTTHMLDMFPDGPIDRMPDGKNIDIKEQMPFYSLEDIRPDNYDLMRRIIALDGFSPKTIKLPTDTWKAYTRGISYKIFRLELWLTKHALFKAGDTLVPFYHAHMHRNMKIADVSGVLCHYKFTPLFYEQAENAVHEGQYFHNSINYSRYRKILSSCKRLILKDASSKRLGSVNDLIAQSFLDVSDDYMTYFGLTA